MSELGFLHQQIEKKRVPVPDSVFVEEREIDRRITSWASSLGPGDMAGALFLDRVFEDSPIHQAKVAERLRATLDAIRNARAASRGGDGDIPETLLLPLTLGARLRMLLVRRILPLAWVKRLDLSAC